MIAYRINAQAASRGPVHTHEDLYSVVRYNIINMRLSLLIGSLAVLGTVQAAGK